MAQKGKSTITILLVIAVIISAYSFFWKMTYDYYLENDKIKGWEDTFFNEFGDAFGTINALFSALAMIAAAIAIYLQSQELKEQRSELKATRMEFMLNRATDILYKQVNSIGDDLNSIKTGKNILHLKYTFEHLKDIPAEGLVFPKSELHTMNMKIHKNEYNAQKYLIVKQHLLRSQWLYEHLLKRVLGSFKILATLSNQLLRDTQALAIDYKKNKLILDQIDLLRVILVDNLPSEIDQVAKEAKVNFFHLVKHENELEGADYLKLLYDIHYCIIGGFEPEKDF